MRPQLNPGARDLAQGGLYLLKRLISLFLTVLAAVYLTVLVANMGGKLDEIRLVQIRATIAEQLRQDEGFKNLPAEARQQRLEQQAQHEVDRLGLDRPFVLRSIEYTRQALVLDLGRAEALASDKGSRNVADILAERLGPTLLLFGTSSVVVFIASLWIALWLSRRYGSHWDRLFTILAPTSATPSWLVGIVLIVLFAFAVPVAPSGGMVTIPPPPAWTMAYALSLASHIVLPALAIVLSSLFLSVYAWRTLFLLNADSEPVELARAMGLPERLIERQYVLRPALPPVLTNFALMLSSMWMGSILLEQVFEWPGIGSLLFQAMGQHDTPVIIAAVVIYANFQSITLFVLEVAYALLDPRIRLSGSVTTGGARA